MSRLYRVPLSGGLFIRKIVIDEFNKLVGGIAASVVGDHPKTGAGSAALLSTEGSRIEEDASGS